MIKKRAVIIGSYNTADHGWTLTGYKLSDPEQKTNYVEKPSGDGSWDLSTAMTDGVPKYKDRSLTVTLELSEGTRAERCEVISHMVNSLDGLEWHIELPDHPNHYLEGRVHVAEDYNNMAHAAVTVTAVVRPWFFSKRETVVSREFTSREAQTLLLRNNGRKVLVPSLTVESNAGVLLVFSKGAGIKSITLETGTHTWPWLVLAPGVHELSYQSLSLLDEVCTLTVSYREAVLR